MGQIDTKGNEAVYMKIPSSMKTKWRKLALKKRNTMTGLFLDWLEEQ